MVARAAMPRTTVAPPSSGASRAHPPTTSWLAPQGVQAAAVAEAGQTPTLDALRGGDVAQAREARPWWADPLEGVGARAAGAWSGAVEAAREGAARTGLFRLGMDNRFPGPGADTTAFLSEREEAQAYFDRRLAAARAYLQERGMEGTIAAKLVTADIVNLAGGSPVEHAEWQMHLVPNPGRAVDGRIDPKRAPGMFDERRLEEFVRSQGARSEGSEILRSEDHPLFLGRLNYGTAGSGMYTKVPDYAEIGGHRYDTREVELMTTTDPEQVKASIDAMYAQQGRPYAVDGVCHQGAALVGQMLGLDPAEVASRVQASWATRLKFGRTGRDGR